MIDLTTPIKLEPDKLAQSWQHKQSPAIGSRDCDFWTESELHEHMESEKQRIELAILNWLKGN